MATHLKDEAEFRRLTGKPLRSLGTPQKKPHSKGYRGPKQTIHKTHLEPYFQAYGLSAPTAEFRFHPIRRWRFDFCWVELRVSFEYDGSTWTRGRHVRGAGVSADNEKINEAQIMGYIVIRGTSDTVRSGECFEQLKRAIESRAAFGMWCAGCNEQRSNSK